MTTSVCMGIYNGEKYIEQQLESIYEQTKQPDEVILCDDGSTDATVSIVMSFIKRHGLDGKWRLLQNTENKGYPENFYYAMSLCTQEIVFLADQDDIWKPEKLEKMCEVFETHSQAKVVCCKFGLIDAQGNRIRAIMQPTVSRESCDLNNVSIEKVLYKCEWPGMVLAYSREWYETKRKLINRRMTIPHDLLICAWAGEEQGFLQMDLELAFHRRHDKNIGEEEHRIQRLLRKEKKLRDIETYCRYLQEFEKNNILVTQEGRKALEKKLSFMQDRYAALADNRLRGIGIYVKKHREQVRLSTVICDMLIVLKAKLICK